MQALSRDINGYFRIYFWKWLAVAYVPIAIGSTGQEEIMEAH